LENAQEEYKSRYEQQGKNLSHGRKEEHGMKLRSNIEKTDMYRLGCLLAHIKFDDVY
jgi:hypothetical protein